MKIKTAVVGVALALSAASTGLVASPAHAAAHAPVVAKPHKHKCTKTSSGHCIAGGQFCPQASYGKSGWDAKGRRYVCKGSHSHPHWMKP